VVAVPLTLILPDILEDLEVVAVELVLAQQQAALVHQVKDSLEVVIEVAE
jgi:hypothetical protein